MKRRLATGLLSVVLWIGAGVAHAAPYGINTHLPDDEVLDKVQAAGIGSIRVDFNWFAIEPSRGVYEWGAYDRIVAAARARGLSIFATLAYTPGWANGGRPQSHPPDDVRDWTDFVATAVTRYRDEITFWGLWNEPNLDHFFEGTPQDYLDKILLPGAEAIRRANPSARVLGPELAHLNSLERNWALWMDAIFQGGGKGAIDIVTHHIYRDDVEELFRNLEVGEGIYPSVLQVLERNGVADKPFWLTETGWPTDDPEAGETPEQQAENYEAFLTEMLYDSRKLRIDRVFFYEIIDDPTPEVPKWGILHADRTEKPAYGVYQRFIAEHPNGDPIEDPNACGILPHFGGGSARLVLFLAFLSPLFLTWGGARPCPESLAHREGRQGPLRGCPDP
ncbi:MAG: hypothetical protein D6812_06235 [Deltaproteobacteria bacterium]|nr:MAG: hypothetical protein D6812_06235 [Deltaproteobacteria bacterium]